MQPIHELLSRIRWDEAYAAAEFVIGYEDHLAAGIVRVPFSELWFPDDDPFRFAVLDEEGEEHHVPYHRVREVWRNGELIWARHPPPSSPPD